jgi:hypothetical protein
MALIELSVWHVRTIATLATGRHFCSILILRGCRGYQIFFEHGRWLLKIAAEQCRQSMLLDTYRNIARRLRNNHRLLNDAHQQLMKSDSAEP